MIIEEALRPRPSRGRRRLWERLGLPPAPDGFQYCTRHLGAGHRAPLPLAQFPARGRRGDGWCLACHAAYALEKRHHWALERARRVVAAAGEAAPPLPTLPATVMPAEMPMVAEIARPHLPPRPPARALDRYATLFAAQAGKCWVCEQSEHRVDDDGLPAALEWFAAGTPQARVEALLCGDCDEGLKRLRHSAVRLTRGLMLLLGPAMGVRREVLLHELD